VALGGTCLRSSELHITEDPQKSSLNKPWLSPMKAAEEDLDSSLLNIRKIEEPYFWCIFHKEFWFYTESLYSIITLVHSFCTWNELNTVNTIQDIPIFENMIYNVHMAISKNPKYQVCQSFMLKRLVIPRKKFSLGDDSGSSILNLSKQGSQESFREKRKRLGY